MDRFFCVITYSTCKL